MPGALLIVFRPAWEHNLKPALACLLPIQDIFEEPVHGTGRTNAAAIWLDGRRVHPKRDPN